MLLLYVLISSWLTQLVHGRFWEIKTSPKGESYHLPGLSLQDHNAAFSSSAYCVTALLCDTSNNNCTSTANGLSRILCDECTSCKWKQRHGFTTELEWQAAVTAEMDRLVGGLYQEQKQELVGSWIAEAPVSLNLHMDMMDEISSSLGVALNNLVVSEKGRRQFFVVSGTPSVVKGMLAAGFVSLTPIPPRLKVHPFLEEQVAELLPGILLQEPPIDRDEKGEGKGGGHTGLYAQLAAAPPSSSSSSSHDFAPYNITTAVASSSPPRLLSPAATTTLERAGVSSTSRRRPGHAMVDEVIAGGGNKLAIGYLRSRARAYAAALDIAMHGQVHWVAPKPALTSADYFSNKLVQQWPDDPLSGGGGGSDASSRSSEYEEDDEVRPIPHHLHSKYSPIGDNWNDWRTKMPPLYEIGITGEGAVVGVTDQDRLDMSNCFFEDENIKPKFKKVKYKGRKYGMMFESKKHRKVRQYVTGHGGEYGANTNFKAADHGTKVAGCVAGYPSSESAGADYENYSKFLHSMGTAFDAKIAFYEFPRTRDEDEDEHGKKRGIKERVSKWLNHPSFNVDTTDLGKHVFPHAYSVGARVYTFSFGHSQHIYSAMAGPVDEYCFKHQDFIVIVAAGNKGAPTPDEGIAGTVTYPGSAKNVVAVGSHVNFGYGPNQAPDHKHLPNQYFNRPDRLSDFSSRGLTVDGRIKPDVCGPGEDISTAASNPDAPPGAEESCDTIFAQGTSYAAPTVAGVTVLVRQYFTEGHYPDGKRARKQNGFQPMGALLKAVLVNSGRPLFLWMPQELETVSLPNKDMGWGAVDVSNTLVTPSSPEGQALKVFGEWSKDCARCPKLYEGDVCDYTIEVMNRPVGNKQHDASPLPLKVTLVWYDYPSYSDAQQVTVNNLDLSVTASPYYWSAPLHPNGLTSPDEVNTVEHIAIPSPVGGSKYTVKVKGTSVPMGPQPFSLVISGSFDRDNVKVTYPPDNYGKCGGDGDHQGDKRKKENLRKNKNGKFH